MKKKNILMDFEVSHQISINMEEKHFVSYDEFLLWKEETEIESKCCFFTFRKEYKNINNDPCYEGYCFRSGNFISESKGLRHLKIQGSRKINGHCPAGIKLIKHDNGECTVHFSNTHVGHINELAHLFF